MVPRQNILILCGLLCLAAVGLLSTTPFFAELKQAMQTRMVATGVLDYGAMGKILKQLHLVDFTYNDFKRFKATEDSGDDIGQVTFQKKRRVGDEVFVANPQGKITFQSTVMVRSVTQKPDWPILSIAIDDERLNDPDKGIQKNPNKKGREWERLAQVSYIEDGRVLFETYAGLRNHGGLRLKTGKYDHGYKIYFRKRYGLAAVPDGVIFAEHEVPLRTLVVQPTSWPPNYPMNNPLAYDLARKTGALVPMTRLVEIYVNGESQGMGYVTEHLSRRQWGQRFGHDDYVFYKYRADVTYRDEVDYALKFANVVRETKNFTYDYVAGKIDLDNLSNQVFTWAFGGTTDFCQGVGIYDRQDPQAKMAWLTWDLDHSFYDFHVSQLNRRKNWQQEGFSLVYNNSNQCFRTTLFARLMKESPQFRQQFIARIVDLLNHRLTEKYLLSRVDYYARMLRQFGQAYPVYIGILTEFMKNRPEFLRREMAELFSLNGPFSCRVDVPADAAVLIDGHPYDQQFSGRYFASTPVRLEVPAERRAAFRSWRINGKEVNETTLTLALGEDTLVQPVFQTTTGQNP